MTGQTLKELRLAAKLTQTELASRLGWDQTRLSRVEQQKNLRFNDIQAIAHTLGHKVAVVVLDDDTAAIVDQAPSLRPDQRTMLRAVAEALPYMTKLTQDGLEDMVRGLLPQHADARLIDVLPKLTAEQRKAVEVMLASFGRSNER